MVNIIITNSFTNFKNHTEIQVDECLAELLYLKRSIDTFIQYKDAERATRLFEEHILSKAENKENLLITKYYVKLLLLYDEYQLSIEPKNGYDQLKEASRLNRQVLVAKHKHQKETIRIQLNKIHKFKFFMDKKTFEENTSSAMRTHMKKPEMVSVMRALAVKYSELGEHDQALNYVERVKNKIGQFYENTENLEMLLISQNEIEILKKKNVTNDLEVNRKIVNLAKSQVDLAVKLFGEKTFITNQTMLTYALALSKCPDM